MTDIILRDLQVKITSKHSADIDTLGKRIEAIPCESEEERQCYEEEINTLKEQFQDMKVQNYLRNM